MKIKDVIYNIDTFNGIFGIRFNRKDIRHTEEYGDIFVYFDSDMRIIGFDMKDADKRAFDLLSRYVKHKFNDLIDGDKNKKG